MAVFYDREGADEVALDISASHEKRNHDGACR